MSDQWGLNMLELGRIEQKIVLSFCFVLTMAGTVRAADENRDCLWGTRTQQTTYQKPYNPILAPVIPVVNLGRDGRSVLDSQAVSPETAVQVVGSDGSCYSYYYKDVIEYRLKAEYQYLAGVLPAIVRPPLVYNTVTAKNGDTSVVVEQSAPAIDLRYYDSYKVRVKVVIPCSKNTPCLPASKPATPAPVSFREQPGSSSVGVQIEAKPPPTNAGDPFTKAKP